MESRRNIRLRILVIPLCSAWASEVCARRRGVCERSTAHHWCTPLIQRRMLARSWHKQPDPNDDFIVPDRSIVSMRDCVTRSLGMEGTRSLGVGSPSSYPAPPEMITARDTYRGKGHRQRLRWVVERPNWLLRFPASLGVGPKNPTTSSRSIVS